MKKDHCLFLLSMLACFLFIPMLKAQTVTVTVNSSDKRQNITGIGAQFYEDQKDDLLYDIGISVGRIWFGAATGWWNEPSNDNADPNTLNLSAFTEVSATKVNAVKEAVNKGVKFFITVGSPPEWQKDTTSSLLWWKILQSQGKPYADYRTAYYAGGKLLPSMYAEFGEFVTGCVKKYYEQIGSYPFAVSPQNEPEFPEPYFSCVYTGSEMVEATKAIGNALAAASLSSQVKIIFAEQTFVQGNVLPWAQLANADALCKNYIHAFANHAYSEDPNGGGMASPTQWAQLYAESQKTPVKEMWMTEGGPGYGTQSLISIALGGASEFYKAMKYGNCNLFSVYSFSKTEPPRYYSIKNMVRYIRPGAYRINAVSSDTSYIWPLVFKHDTHHSLTIYVVNNDTKDRNVKFTGLSGTVEAFQTTAQKQCEWVGQYNLNNEIPLPAQSITTLVSCTDNKLPVLTMPDTIVLIKNNSKTITLTGINDGGDGGQTLSLSVWNMIGGANIFSSITSSYTSPNTSATISITPKTDQTGSSRLYICLKDNSSAMNGMFNEKIISVPIYVLPYINRPPTMDNVPDVTYPKSLINTTQLIFLSGVTDGNDGKQKLTLSATSSVPSVATVSTQGATLVKITPKTEGTTTITLTLSDDGINAGGGSGTTIKTFKVTVGNSNTVENFHEETLIFPNPAHQKITLQTSNSYHQYQIMNLQGSIMLEGILLNGNNEIDISSLSAGIYFIRLTGNNKTAGSRFIVQ